MAEIQSCDPRHAWKLLHRALHDDAVLIEIHIAAHIRNVAYHALFKDHDLDLCGALEFDLIFLDERDGFMLPEPVLVITERRISGPFSAKDQIDDLLLCIVAVSRDLDLLNADCKNKGSQKEQDPKKDPCHCQDLLSSPSPPVAIARVSSSSPHPITCTPILSGRYPAVMKFLEPADLRTQAPKIPAEILIAAPDMPAAPNDRKAVCRQACQHQGRPASQIRRICDPGP